MHAELPKTPQYVLDEINRLQEKYNLVELLKPQNSQMVQEFMTDLKSMNPKAHDYLLFPDTKIIDTIAFMEAITSVKGFIQ